MTADQNICYQQNLAGFHIVILELSMNRPGHRFAACLGKAALKTHALQTLRDSRASSNRAKRLECVRFIGAFRPAQDSPWFMVPTHGIKVVRALHERLFRGFLQLKEVPATGDDVIGAGCHHRV